MRLVFALARLYPYWAFAVSLVLLELGLFFKRRSIHSWQYVVWGVSGGLLLGIVVWFVFRGDLHSDQWVRALVGG